ncbi:Alanine racemase [hydrothermal vent metagenome]|uniref:Alanine racemase n=1 Tax=hydrothermal vent metagenome TaxID=652676 RepID=A0A3B1CBX5_9ZZZZ
MNFPAYANINLDRLNSNLDIIHKRAKVPMTPVIKANAYGHGAAPVAKDIWRRKDVAALSVGTVAEGAELRKAGIKGRIIVLDGFLPEQAGAVSLYSLEVVVSSFDEAKLLARKSARRPIPVHVKINTGMTRLGADPEGALDFFNQVSGLKKVAIVGLMTHFAASNIAKGGSTTQISLFSDIISAIRSSGRTIPPIHAANTAAIFRHPQSHYDMVRPGIGIYGIQEFGGKNAGLSPVLSLFAKVTMIRSVKKGTPVSYQSTWISPGKRRVALVAIGYADGYSRSLSNRAHAIINGKKIKQIGIICMDNCLFDVTGANASPGDDVTLIGGDKRAIITVNQLARKIGSITYETLCSIGRRVARIYVKRGKIKMVREGF